MKNPKVFISYSWTSEEHAGWVRELAERLCADGVDAVLDVWDLKPGKDKHHFMEQMVSDPGIDKVLILCDKRYADKADGREGGVGDETQIITPEVYDSVGQTKFIPVIAERGPGGAPYLPGYLKGRIYVDLSNQPDFEEKYESLLRDIYGKPLYLKPQLGKLPARLDDDNSAPTNATTFKLRTYVKSASSGKVAPLLRGQGIDYLEELVVALKSLRLVFDSEERMTCESLEAHLRESIGRSLPLRDEFVTFIETSVKYVPLSEVFEIVPQFFSECTPLVTGNWLGKNTLSDNYMFVVGELFLYTVAALIKAERFDEARLLTTNSYHDAYDHNEAHRFSIFIPSMPHVENHRPSPGLAVHSDMRLASQMLRTRALNQRVTLKDLASADFAMYLYDVVNVPDVEDFPWKYGHGGVRGGVFEGAEISMIRYAESRRYWAGLARFLGVESKDELVSRINRACDSHEVGTRRAITPDKRNDLLFYFKRFDTR